MIWTTADCRRLTAGILLLGMAVLAMPVRAQGLSVLALDPDPVGQGMAGAYTAAASGPFGALYNPAALATEGDNAAALAVQDGLGDARTVVLGGRFAAGTTGGLGLYVLATSSGDLDARDRPGPSSGTFEAQYLAVGAGYARTLGPLQVGVVVKALSERIFEASAAGVAADAGVQVDVHDAIRVGGAVQHLGRMSALNVERTPLPTTYRGGLSIRPFALADASNAVLLSTALHAEAVHRPDNTEPTSIRVGGEVTLFDLITLRGGYIAGDPVRQLTAGAGLAAGAFRVDYALLPYEAGFGTGQLIAVRYGW